MKMKPNKIAMRQVENTKNNQEIIARSGSLVCFQEIISRLFVSLQHCLHPHPHSSDEIRHNPHKILQYDPCSPFISLPLYGGLVYTIVFDSSRTLTHITSRPSHEIFQLSFFATLIMTRFTFAISTPLFCQFKTPNCHITSLRESLKMLLYHLSNI